jgi:hypothetical protein
MSAYHQMGHDSWNLVPAENLDRFSGLILSPVNDTVEQTSSRLEGISNRNSLDVVLDPQFYVPRSARGQLPEWPHFDSGCDTEDLSNTQWWALRCRSLVTVAEQLHVRSICSPAVLPRIYDIPYYEWTLNCADELANAVSSRDFSVLLTAVVSFRDLASPGASDRIASVLTRSALERVYLIFNDDLSARQQWTDTDALVGSMMLIRSLEQAGSKVLVGYCGFDMMLWKFAGARDVATGKFFNLRRFGPERWEEGQTEGRVVEYWTEPTLITWLRENDVTLLRRRLPELITTGHNPFAQEIMTALGANPREPWRALSWRQYLWWFSNLEAQLAQQPNVAIDMLRSADTNWGTLEASRLLLFDRTNDGSWIRPWLNAISGL